MLFKQWRYAGAHVCPDSHSLSVLGVHLGKVKHRNLTTMQKSVNAEASDISISKVELLDTGAQATQTLMLKHS